MYAVGDPRVVPVSEPYRHPGAVVIGSSAEIQVSSHLEAPTPAVWARVTTPEGINDEMRPWLRIKTPGGVDQRDLSAVATGGPIGRSCLEWNIILRASSLRTVQRVEDFVYCLVRLSPSRPSFGIQVTYPCLPPFRQASVQV